MAATTQCCLVLRKWSLLVIYSKYRAYSMAIVKQSKYCLNLIIPLPQYLFHLPSDKLQQELALLGHQLSYTYLKNAFITINFTLHRRKCERSGVRSYGETLQTEA